MIMLVTGILGVVTGILGGIRSQGLRFTKFGAGKSMVYRGTDHLGSCPAKFVVSDLFGESCGGVLFFFLFMDPKTMEHGGAIPQNMGYNH